MENKKKAKFNNGGGMYRGANVPIKTLNIFIIFGIAVLVLATVYLSMNGGFTVTFNTDGGTSIETVKLRYSEYITPPPNPYKEGFTFENWYTEPNLKNKWNFKIDIVTKSMTLYAKWVKNT